MHDGREAMPQWKIFPSLTAKLKNCVPIINTHAIRVRI